MVITDLACGGRWMSLRLAGREWLWSRSDPDRAGVRPGDAFVDAGGLEECVPTVRGAPDHGTAWSRPWRRVGADEVAECGDFVLRRRLRVSASVTASYRLEAAPGFRFVWAAHALLDVSPAARVELPPGAPTRIYPDDGPSYVDDAWPAGGLDQLGPDDGTAVGAVVVGPSAVRVHDGERLELRVHADQPTSIALWRNLAGWPVEQPYRSIGVEPMLGAVFDLATAGPGDAATVPANGFVAWELEVSA
ncbi:MAG TPA: hypothetical protein VGL21_06330 [Jatrophihabitantaceae bacterium]